jgi:hypothetical protein
VVAVAEHYQHAEQVPPLVEQTPPTLRPATRTTAAAWLVRLVLRPLWLWRVELAAVIAAVLVVRWLLVVVGGPLAGLVLVVVALSLPLWPVGVRRGVWLVLHRSRVRRDWSVAARHAGLATHNDRIPRAVKVVPIPAGDRLRVRIPAGGRTSALAEQAEVIAACLEARELRVVREPDNARYATVTIVRRDPLASAGAVPWPYQAAARLSLWQPIPVGVNEDGEWITVSLFERNVLVGGEPGAGKSVALSLLVAVAALDPDAILITLDGKLVELACWAGVAARTVGVDTDDAIGVLRALQGELDARLLGLVANRRRKVHPAGGMPLIVVVIDELAHYLNGPDRRQNAEFANLLRDLVSRGRAVGIIVLAATQKPSTDVIPSAIRDLFGFRWAFRCTTPQASDTVLGQGWASLGCSASSIDAAARGVGLLLHEGGQPVRLRACYLDDEELISLAQRAEALRGAWPGRHRELVWRLRGEAPPEMGPGS